jgi:hypothetical protein
MTRGLDVLQLIQDVDWVVGSFVADPHGQLLVYLMPPEFGQDELRLTATRLASIVRSAELCGVEVEQCDFSFSRYQLVVYRSEAGVVGVLVEAPVSRRALSMAARIALAELPKLIGSLQAAAAAGGVALPLDRFGPVASVTRPE